MMDPTLVELFEITAGVDPDWHHAFDPLDTDGGPFQRLAEKARDTGQDAVSGPAKASPVYGYPPAA